MSVVQEPGSRRVALIASSYAPYVGGVESHVRQVARLLSERGIQVEVWTVDRGEALGTRVVDGITVRYLATPLPARSLRSLMRFAFTFPRSWSRWKRAVKSFKPDLLHVHCFGPNGLYALFLHRRYRIPLAVTSHGETFADDNGVFARSALLRRGLSKSLARSAFVTGCSEMVLDDLRKNFGLTSGDVVPNGVDLDLVPAVDSVGTDDRTFVAVGRLGHTKGFDLLLQAFALVRPADLRLVLIGNGPERAVLEAQAHALGVSDRVVFAGERTPAEVAGAMRAALAVVVPSRVESFGLVVLEAWRAGSPLVVTTRIGAPVQNGVDAVTIDPEHPLEFARTLETIAADPELRAAIAAAGAGRVADFTWESVAQDYVTLYGTVGA